MFIPEALAPAVDVAVLCHGDRSTVGSSDKFDFGTAFDFGFARMRANSGERNYLTFKVFFDGSEDHCVSHNFGRFLSILLRYQKLIEAH